ncbi:aminotransferase class III-fold pyridoxal phosphate-dependent enzyme [Pseudomonas sp. S75]|uniref:aminotransferase class III-fold pyridoxal phosphate-dependent enzyme n=1 Tax=unclassified Pseudomonas TaxID=196821 RepID=UPI0019062663|nr:MULTISPECIES: aminotransferase class III-fold pyridoxal phosphate-dependent enzyme [unclassified Pseudomonas]MBJ9975371.1 aminotransferase class III-fold pyridoxal phosphate-dependent enzyme [Pseudomonas sp. S30]MBK0152655.1 aminotransferase class III-fold pyridoxal phosphate-dependent enzyme [Pseudomonas sp. S75]
MQSTQSREQELVEVFAQAFGLPADELDMDAPLTEIGADSLQLFEVLAPIQHQFGVKLSVKQFFAELQTIRQLHDHLQAQAPGQAAKGFNWMRRSADPVESQARQRYLDELVPRYVQRTGQSKLHAEQVRQRIADSRSGIGFKGSTKEMLYPLVCTEFRDARVRDLDGNEYVDMTMGFGTHLFGHSPAFINQALHDQLEQTYGLGTRNATALEVAQLICEITGMERVAFVNSGTEAIMNAVRAARAATQRNHVVLFSSSYHGHWDAVLASAGPSGISAPVSVGIPEGMVADVSVFEFASQAALDFIARQGERIAAVLIEPVPTRDPGLADPHYLRALREACTASGALLVFDEIVTGFRAHPAGVQGLYGIEADIVTYGKTIGGGLPLGVVAGRANTLDAIDGGLWRYGDASFPAVEPTFFGGTFFQHPLAMATARASLQQVRLLGTAFTERLTERMQAFAGRLNRLFADYGVAIEARSFASFMRLVHRENMDLLYYNLLLRNVYIWEWRCWFISAAHEDRDLDQVYQAFVDSLKELRAHAMI